MFVYTLRRASILYEICVETVYGLYVKPHTHQCIFLIYTITYNDIPSSLISSHVNKPSTKDDYFANDKDDYFANDKDDYFANDNVINLNTASRPPLLVTLPYRHTVPINSPENVSSRI